MWKGDRAEWDTRIADSYLPVGFLLSENVKYTTMENMYQRWAKQFKKQAPDFPIEGFKELLSIINSIYGIDMFTGVPRSDLESDGGEDPLGHVASSAKKKAMSATIDAAGGRKEFVSTAQAASSLKPDAIASFYDAVATGFSGNITGNQLGKMIKNIQDHKESNVDSDNLLIERWKTLAGLL